MQTLDGTVILPRTWRPTDGLEYPTIIKVKGQDVVLKSYAEHHRLIKKLCKNQNDFNRG